MADEVVVTRLSKHFCDRWEERVGGRPTVEGVNWLIRQGQCLRRQQDLWRQDRWGMRPYRLLAEYWCHRAGMLIRVDSERGIAVTVIVPEGMEATRRQYQSDAERWQAREWHERWTQGGRIHALR